MTRYPACLVGALFTCAATSAQAVTISATADTFVRVGSPDTNYGTDPVFSTANDGGSFGVPKGDDRWSIMRFSISDSTGPFSAASLELEQVSGSGADFVLYGIPDLGADEFFDQSTYTFNTSAYATTSSGSSNDGGLDKTSLIELGTFTTTGAQTISFSDPDLLNFVNADTNDMVALILYQSTQSKFVRAFNSSEATSGQLPELNVTAVPEPGTYALLVGLASMAGILLRRRVKK